MLVKPSIRFRIQYKTSFFSVIFWMYNMMFIKMDSSDDIYSYRHIFMHIVKISESPTFSVSYRHD